MELDYDFILDRRLAVGAGLWTAEAMAELARAGFTHLINLQAEFDDSELARAAGISPYWNPTEDDLQPKPATFFEPAVRFALAAMQQPNARVYVHCAAGVHRGPLMTAAILVGLGYEAESSFTLVASRRVWADFPPVYVASLYDWIRQRSTLPQ